MEAPIAVERIRPAPPDYWIPDGAIRVDQAALAGVAFVVQLLPQRRPDGPV